jgi:hypothetical protein
MESVPTNFRHVSRAIKRIKRITVTETENLAIIELLTEANQQFAFQFDLVSAPHISGRDSLSACRRD